MTTPPSTAHLKHPPKTNGSIHPNRAGPEYTEVESESSLGVGRGAERKKEMEGGGGSVDRDRECVTEKGETYS